MGRAHGAGGAVEALVRARDEGLTRFIGVTGHGLRIAGMHLRSLERFDFDSVLFPYNFSLLRRTRLTAHDVEALFDLCGERRVAVQTIKSVARRRWADDRPRPASAGTSRSPTATCWPGPCAGCWPTRAVFLNTSSDGRLLRRHPRSGCRARRPPPSDAEMQADLATYGIEPLFDGDALERI